MKSRLYKTLIKVYYENERAITHVMTIIIHILGIHFFTDFSYTSPEYYIYLAISSIIVSEWVLYSMREDTKELKDEYDRVMKEDK